MDYNGFKNELKNYYKHLQNVDQLKSDIEMIIYEMSGVKGIRYDKEPSAYNPELANERRLEMIDRIAEKEIELDYTIAAIKYIEMRLKKLSDEDRQICLKVISDGISAEKVGREIGYSRPGIWKRIKRELEKIL